MKVHLSTGRWLAATLLKLARGLLPRSRRDWAQAMQAELDHLGNDDDALRWALGCVVAGAKERIDGMFGHKLKVSRWILVPEMLLCFVPLSFLCRDSVAAGAHMVRAHGEALQEHALRNADGTLALITVIAGAVVGALGPLGLIGASCLVVGARLPRNRWFGALLIGAPVLYGLLTLTARLATAGPGALGPDAPDSFDFWSGILLLSALPSLGAAHWLSLVPRTPQQSLPAAR